MYTIKVFDKEVFRTDDYGHFIRQLVDFTNSSWSYDITIF